MKKNDTLPREKIRPHPPPETSANTNLPRYKNGVTCLPIPEM